jgi:hypothetical protein
MRFYEQAGFKRGEKTGPEAVKTVEDMNALPRLIFKRRAGVSPAERLLRTFPLSQQGAP